MIWLWIAAGHLFFISSCRWQMRDPHKSALWETLVGMLLCWLLGPTLWAIEWRLRRS